MSEQLTWDGLLPKKPSESKSTAPTKVKRPVDLDIEARINRLIEAKSKAEAAVLVTTKIDVQIEPEKKIIAETKFATSTSESPGSLFSEEVEEIELVVGGKPDVLTVSNLNKQIKVLLEKNFPFLWVKGEISNFKIPGSGHIYFTLKDSNSQVRAVMFKGFAQGLKFKVEDGMEVLVRCRVTAYEPRGDYQLFCEVMEPVGFGALQIAFEQLKTKLQGEGLFDPAKKRAIPQFPTRIGIITSPTGAAIRDMLNILQRRSGGGVDITILPTSVQGDKAPGEIVTALNLANKMGLARFDVLIVGRGGGSIEDLWAFNTEEVARAIGRSIIPIISAVGHEVDFTIGDFTADLRAPTPSAAAELVVKNKKDLIERIKLLERQVLTHAHKKLMVTKAVVDGFSKRLIDPKRRLQDLMLRCDDISDRLIQAVQRYFQNSVTQVRFFRERLGSPQRRLDLSRQKFLNADGRLKKSSQRFLENKRNAFNQQALHLNGLSPLAVLDRGYSIVKKGPEIIKEASQVAKGDVITIKLHKGEVSSEVL